MGENWTRRMLLTGMAGAVGGLAGCRGDGAQRTDTQTDLSDSDGDGVIDSEDYAPNDPAVQEKADIQEATPSVTATPTPTPEPTPTATPRPTSTATPRPTPTATPEVTGELRVTEPLSGQVELRSYSATTVTATLSAGNEISQNRVKILDFVYGYPDGDGVAYGVSDPLSVPSDTRTKTVRFDLSVFAETGLPTDTRLYHNLFAMPADQTLESVAGENLTHLTESDPFSIARETRQLRRDLPKHTKEDVSLEHFDRHAVEGGYKLRFSGQTDGRAWDLSYYIYKSAYSQAYNEPRGRDYDEYVTVAQEEGIAGELATILNDEAERNGFSGKRAKADLVVDWVQSLPYVTDDVSRGYDEYPKLAQETVVDGSGDCEDTAILLAAILQADPFGYDTVLIGLPGHMGTGIYGSDLPGYYWTYRGRRYYYIETTGTGWGIGDLPEPYQDADGTVYQV